MTNEKDQLKQRSSDDRLAAALRANLRRRKDQQRGRQSETAPLAEPAGGEAADEDREA